MKRLNIKYYFYITIFFIFESLCLVLPAGFSDQNSISIETFDNYNNNIFDAWLLRKESKDAAGKIYKIKNEKDNKYLNATSVGTSIQITKKVKWDINSYPILSWKWRMWQIPKKANEEARGKNDSGAAIYVVFQRKKIPFVSWKYQPINVIKYIWSSTQPVGKIIQKKKTKFGRTIYEGRFIVIETGKKNIGKWIIKKRNVLEDYKKVFGKSPKYSPIIITILTDSNDTKSKAVADYDDIKIHRVFSGNVE